MNYFLPLSWLHTSLPVLALLVVSGCGTDSTDQGPGGSGGTGVSADELLNLGEYEVGFREMMFSYTPPASDEMREIPMLLWYPAASNSGAPPALYALADIVEIPREIALDAPPVAEGGNFPLAIYSHGSGGQALLGYPFGELLASHGWIVASPDHVGNTALDGLGGTSTPFALTALNRPADITGVIDWLESGLGEDELAGAADTSAVFVIGHSFGGYTAFAIGGVDQDFDALTENCDEQEPSESCMIYAEPEVEAAYRAGFRDPRVVAIAPQAPALLSPVEGTLAALDIPTMLMSGLQDKTTPHATQAVPAWEGLDHPEDIWVDMPRGAHQTFITICHDLDPMLLSFFQPNAPEDGCDFEQFTPTPQAIPVLAAYLLAFGRRHVLGETEWDEILRGKPIGDIDDQFEITVR
jgi:predicted dienelactone hydrolase